MTDLSSRLAELSPQKRELLLRQLRTLKDPAGDPTRPARPALRARSERTGDFPLSYAQQRLWFLDRMEPGNPFYNMPGIVRLAGPLDEAALRRALGEVVRRHEVLRTTFPAVDGRPVQRVGPPSGLPLPVVDLSALGPPRRAAAARALAAAEVRRPLDLERGPVLRALLLRLGDAERLLAFALHHIASDAWSMRILVGELTALYAAFAAGRNSPLPPLSIQYADYAAAEHQGLERAQGALAAQLAYWRDRLAPLPASLELPGDRPRPAVQTFRGAQLPLAIPEGTAQGIRELARSAGATPFMAFLAAFLSLLQRYSGREDLAVGTPIANRDRVEIEGLIGFFVNTLVLRVDLAGDPPFRELLARVRGRTLEAFAHASVPFERLVEELQPERDLARSPLFQVLFAFQSLPPATRTGGGTGGSPGSRIAAEPLPVDAGRSLFDLTLTLEESPTRIEGTIEYRTDLFDPARMRRMAGHFRALLDGVAADPRRRLSELPLLTAAERHQVAVEWQGSPAGRAPLRVDELFAAQAARTPEAPALYCDEKVWSYRELDARAGRWARRLSRLLTKSGPEPRVGVCLERSADLVATLLGVWRAGGAYVPLDPAYPAERLAFMVEDAGLAVLVAGPGAPEALVQTAAAVVRPEDVDVEDRAEGPAGPGSGGADALAYVLYTSGSTGRPKGVAIEHRSVAALLAWAGAEFSRAELAGVLAATSISFDLSVFELFAPLVHGGAVVLAENALALPGLPAAGRVTLVNTVPSAMAELVRRDRPEALRTVNLAGEPLRRELVDDLHERWGVERVWNLYGPSEDTTYSTAALADRTGGAPPIGRPVVGSCAYVVDAGGALLPAGVPGELWLGGAGLARGYLARPELTAERFAPDPFGGEPGSRLYQTGDRVRLREDGRLDFLGRLDHQVKVRGFRIELGEVEAALHAHPAVAQAAVVARPEEQRLAAFVVARAGHEETESALTSKLRALLRARLPEHAVPSPIVLLESLPLTPNGKVDRLALAGREVARTAPGEAAGAPRTPAEELLAAIWERLLGVEAVAPADDFFALGGHSLLAAQVAARLRDAFGVELPLRALFEAPTLAALAARIEAARRETAGPQAPPLARLYRDGVAGRSRPPLSFGQERLWFLDQLESREIGRAAYNLPSAVRLTGGLLPGALAASLSEVVRRHESLRTVFALEAGEPVQVVLPAAAVPLPEIDLAAVPFERAVREARRLAAREARAPFRLDRGPLLRARLLRLASEHRLLLTVHHIASDGWSMGVLVREVVALYAAFAAGRPSPLPELPLQYADYAAWQRAWLAGEALAAQLAWWRAALAGAPALLDLPTDRPRPPVQTFRGDRRTLEWGPVLREGVRALGRQRGMTPFMVILAAFQVLLHRWSGQPVVVVGTPIANRGRRETEELVGFFANTLALAGDLSGAPSFTAFLGRVREAALGAYAHQELPFEKLVEELQPERSLAHAPLFQVLFTFAPPASRGDSGGGGDGAGEAGLAMSPLDVDLGAAKFDLTLAVAETGRGLGAGLELNTDLFDPATAHRLLAQLGALLAAAVAAPERPLAELPLLGEAERHQLLMDWSRGGEVEDEQASLYELFARQAARTPEETAVVHGGERLSFRELALEADRLARHLRAWGVGPEVAVGICLERTPRMVAAILGVLAAGGAYLPLDPAYPLERLEFMLADAGAPVLLTEQRLLDRLGGAGGEDAARSGLKVVCLDRGLPPKPETGRGGVEALPGNLAYLIYTSGSTGRPKGVAIEHRSAVAMVRWAAGEFLPEERAAVLASTSICFDLSVFELFLPLCCGGTVVLADTALDLPRVAAETEVTLVNTVPSAMAELVRGGLPRSVRTVSLAGEALPRALVDEILSGGVVNRVMNLYGPSEDTTYSTVASFRCGEAQTGSPPIGRPVAGGRAYALDAALAPVPAGVAGELYLGGAGLARGYLGRPELTAERFVPDPWAEEPGSRLYRTGDLVRWRADGELLFLGRLDHQVKIRGFRIELGEVEAALRGHPDIAEAVVVSRRGGLAALEREDEPAGSDLRLVAYVVAAGGKAPEAEKLRGFLRAKLPGHMVPWAFVPLAALPLTANGKVDRGGLPAPGRTAWGEAEVEEPRSEAERTIAAVWREALRLDRVGVHDNFFDSGGHSLLAVRVRHRLQAAFGRELPLVALFEHPTIAALARHLERGPAEPASRQRGQDRGALRRDAAARRRSRPSGPAKQGNEPAAGTAGEET